jgi:hypothetical protein
MRGPLRKFLDHEIETGMKRLNIRTRDALEREAERYPAVVDASYWRGGGYERLPEDVVARVFAVWYLNALTYYKTSFEDLDESLAELHKYLPRAATTRPSNEVIAGVVKLGKRDEASCRKAAQWWAKAARAKTAAAA